MCSFSVCFLDPAPECRFSSTTILSRVFEQSNPSTDDPFSLSHYHTNAAPLFDDVGLRSAPTARVDSMPSIFVGFSLESTSISTSDTVLPSRGCPIETCAHRGSYKLLPRERQEKTLRLFESSAIFGICWAGETSNRLPDSVLPMCISAT